MEPKLDDPIKKEIKCEKCGIKFSDKVLGRYYFDSLYCSKCIAGEVNEVTDQKLKLKYQEKTKSKAWQLKAWREERKKIITDKSKCEYCENKENLIIHHSYKYKDYTQYSELKDKINIIILCKKCHFILHKYGMKLCKICKKKYHHIRYDCCFNCLSDKKKNQIEKRKEEETIEWREIAEMEEEEEEMFEKLDKKKITKAEKKIFEKMTKGYEKSIGIV